MTWTRDRIGALLFAIAVVVLAAIWIAAAWVGGSLGEKLALVGMIVFVAAAALGGIWVWLMEREGV